MKPIDLHVTRKDHTLLQRVAELLAARWDPNAEFATPSLYLDAAGNPTTPEDRSARAHAEVILAMYAAGGPETDVVGYLRRAEEAALGSARTTANERWAPAARTTARCGLTTPLPGSTFASSPGII